MIIQPATADEIKWLKFMREEEKLARDVYRFLYERWNFSVFDRIAGSEQRHFATVGTLLTRYSVPDPASDVPGVFADERLAVLYAELTTKGATSLRDAIEVGIIIEKQDIGDLEVTARVLWGFSHGLIQIAMTKAEVLARDGVAVPQLTQQALDLLTFALTDRKT